MITVRVYFFVKFEGMSFLPGTMMVAQKRMQGHGSAEVWVNVSPWEFVKTSGSDLGFKRPRHC